MSIKNQNRLPIFALLIMGLTALSLVGLNFLVDKIASIKPTQLATKTLTPRHQGIDDALPKQKQPKNPPSKIPPPGQAKNLPSLEKNGAIKRIRNPNEQAPEIDRRPAERKNSTQERPSSPPANRNAYGYPPPLESLDPAERALIEQEMQRRRQMMRDYPSGPPPGYYPEPDNPPDDSYDPEYEDDYYDPDYEGRREDKTKVNTKTSEYENRTYEDYPGEDNPNYSLGDEYLEEYLRKDNRESGPKQP